LSLGSSNLLRALAILGNLDTVGGGSLLDGGTVVAAFLEVLTLKVKILKLDDKVINGGKRVAALACKSKGTSRAHV
jgi:hypothetical protein